MKKLLAMIFAAIMALAVMTGCSQEPDSSGSQPDAPSSSRPVTDEPEIDYNYENLLSTWKNNFEGYWADEVGSYLYFGYDEEGTPAVSFYNAKGTITGYALVSNLTAGGGKSSLYLELEYPRSAMGLSQVQRKEMYSIERAGETEEMDFAYILISDREGKDHIYAWAGTGTEDDIKEAMKNAAKA